MDDRLIAIIAISIIAIMSIFYNLNEIPAMAISAIAGFVTGKAMEKSK